MKRTSFRKFSILGLVLIGASAVTAAVMPKASANTSTPGFIDASSGNEANQTCRTPAGLETPNCTMTADSATTVGEVGSDTQAHGDVSSPLSATTAS